VYKRQIYQIAESNRIETFFARIGMLYRNWHYVVAGFCAYNVWIFAVLKQWLLQQRETEASFVNIFFYYRIDSDECSTGRQLRFELGDFWSFWINLAAKFVVSAVN